MIGECNARAFIPTLNPLTRLRSLLEGDRVELVPAAHLLNETRDGILCALLVTGNMADDHTLKMRSLEERECCNASSYNHGCVCLEHGGKLSIEMCAELVRPKSLLRHAFLCCMECADYLVERVLAY